VKKLVLIAIVLMLGLGSFMCDMKGNTVSGPKDVESSANLQMPCGGGGDSIPSEDTISSGNPTQTWFYTVWYSQRYDYDLGSNERANASVSGNNITVVDDTAMASGFNDPIVTATVTLEGNVFTITQTEQPQPGDSLASGCAPVRDWRIGIHNVPAGIYHIVLPRPWGDLVFTVYVNYGNTDPLPVYQ
jgi:hypothetical protein